MNLQKILARFSKAQLTAGAILLQVTIILFLIVSYGSILSTGTKVYLRIAPVDPHDLIRGDYVTLRFEQLSELSIYNYSSNKSYDDYYGSTNSNTTTKYRVGDDIYVSIEQGLSGWTRVYNGESKTKPTTGVFIKGKVTKVTPGSYNETVAVNYGIEQYFIPERTGSTFSTRNAVAEVYINKDGNASIKRIFINNKPWP